MTIANRLLIAGAFAALSLAPAHAGASHRDAPSFSPGEGATSIPEPSDTVLLLMAVVGIVVGRRLHARKPLD